MAKKSEKLPSGKKGLVGIIREEKRTCLDARFNLDPKVQRNTKTRRNARRQVARAATALSLQKKAK